MRKQHHAPSTLIEHMKAVIDPRVNRTRRHNLEDILVIAVCTLLCGGETFCDMENFGKRKKKWLTTLLGLPGGIPSHDTFNRVFAAIDPDSFAEQFIKWTEGLRSAIKGEIVAIDGKALRRARNADEDTRFVVSAWADTNRLVLGQLRVPNKTNEITVVPQLLRALDLEGCIVTTDAMGCQKKIVKEITDQKADYVLALKANHKGLWGQVSKHFTTLVGRRDCRRTREICNGRAPRPKNATWSCHVTHDKGHGRIEERRYFQSSDLSMFEEASHWKGLKTVGMVERIRIQDGIRSADRFYYISSLPRRVRTFAKAVRAHWGVENSCHWTLDVSFREDDNRARSGNSAENLATLRRLALNLLKRDATRKRGIRGKQLDAGWDNIYLTQLLGMLDA